jgi:hypothetical protein
LSRSDFDAFAVPSGIVPDGSSQPELTLLTRNESDVTVRCLDTTPEWVGRVADALLASRDTIADRRATEIASSLGRVGARFLDAGDPLRRDALALLPATSGLSPEMAAAVLDGMAADWTEDRLLELLRQELGSQAVLDGFVEAVAAGGDTAADRRVMAVGPWLCAQIVAGSVPGVGVTALIRSLLLKGPTLLKPGVGDVVLPVLFARALREEDPELAESLAVVYWPGGKGELDAAALSRADVVTAYGSDETVRTLRALCPVTTRFVAYHHRVSVGVVGREALDPSRLESTAEEVADAVALFDQRGCVSPQVIFVEEGAAGPEDFARALGTALGRLEERLPSGPLEPAEASSLHQLRGSAELLAAAGRATVIHGGESPWTVILDSGDGELGACAGRIVRVCPVRDAEDVPSLLDPLAPHLQTVGVAGLGDRLERLARALGRAGASRVVPLASVAFPPPWWHHDGRGPLRDLVRWVDLEVD